MFSVNDKLSKKLFYDFDEKKNPFYIKSGHRRNVYFSILTVQTNFGLMKQNNLRIKQNTK